MSQIKFINDAKDVVEEAVTGFCRTHPSVVRIEGTNVVAKKDNDKSKVALICGGGSGHEPAHIGFVADGWLNAAVCGPVFASPPTSAVGAALAYLKPSSTGVLVIIKNYMGDIMNFGLAVQYAKSRGQAVETLVVDDDVFFGRGIAGTVVFYKVLGAAAANGASLTDLKALGEKLLQNLRSSGASLSSCAIPGAPPNVVFGDNEMEVGLGIHGEKGAERKAVQPARKIVEELVSTIVKGKPEEGREPWATSGSVALFVNNLGATTDIEMSVVTNDALELLEGLGFTVSLVSTARFMTALDMHGFSITVLRLADAAWSGLLTAQALPDAGFAVPLAKTNFVVNPNEDPLEAALTAGKSDGERSDAAKKMIAITKDVLESLAAEHARYSALDAAVGDGDIGGGVERSAAAVVKVINELPWETNTPAAFAAIGQIIADSFAGTSGPLYGAFFMVGSRQLKTKAGDNNTETFVAAFSAGAQAVSDVGGAKPNDRTMYDVLFLVAQFCQKAVGSAEFYKDTAKVARDAAASVAQLPAKKGRSRYLQGKEIGQQDPGSEIVADWVCKVVSLA